MIAPYLFYRDAPAALAFLCRAFGFEERMRHEMADGRIGHAELCRCGDRMMLASSWEGFGMSPLDLPGTHASLFLTVEDVDAHHARARDAGATIVAEPEDQHGERAYRAVDPEGHRWIFSNRREEA